MGKKEKFLNKGNKTAQFGGSDLKDKVLLLITMNLRKRHHVVKSKTETLFFASYNLNAKIPFEYIWSKPEVTFLGHCLSTSLVT